MYTAPISHNDTTTEQTPLTFIAQYLHTLRIRRYSPKSIATFKWPLEYFASFLAGRGVDRLQDVDIADIDLPAATAIVLGKGSKQRVVPIGRTAMRYLETYITAVRPFLARRRSTREDGQPLFLDHFGGRLRYQTLLRLVHHHADAAKMPVNVTPHCFRRSCTTELLRSNANMYHVKDLLGHESLDTLKHYALLTITDLRATHARCHPRERDQDRHD